MPLLQATHLRRSYGDLPVLKGIDMTVDAGEVVSIVGASGAGKTTLLQILGTLDRPDTGEVIMDGQSVFSLTDKELAAFRNRKIGFVFQFNNLLPEFTTLENVCLPGLIAGRSEKEVRERATQLLTRLGLQNRLAHVPSQLSGGEQQRTAVARALINEPVLVFADEPSGNLDTRNADELHKLFFELRQELGQTFIIVTHNETLAALADRKIVLEDGVVVRS